MPRTAYTATSLNNLGFLLQNQGDIVGARQLIERAVAATRKSSSSPFSDIIGQGCSVTGGHSEGQQCRRFAGPELAR
jgi:Tetratricopeptide repeat